MNDLILPAAIGELLIPGTPLVAAIVEGELETGFYFGPDRFNPPAWLVALRDARCETCRGRGRVKGPAETAVDRDCTVDRCHDGRLLHDVRVECETCLGGKYRYCTNCGNDSDGSGAIGYRTIRCLVDVAPVYDVNALGDQWPALFVTGSFVLRAEKKTAWSFVLTSAHVYALAAACGKPPADWPGMYAVILTEVQDDG